MPKRSGKQIPRLIREALRLQYQRERLSRARAARLWRKIREANQTARRE